jgi:hypothetical protein
MNAPTRCKRGLCLQCDLEIQEMEDLELVIKSQEQEIKKLRARIAEARGLTEKANAIRKKVRLTTRK